MKNIFIIILCFIGIVCINLPNSNAKSMANTPIVWQVYFSPNGGAEEAVVEEINNAKDSIYVQAYSFTSEPIADALIAAKNKGVTVSIILDKSDISGKGSQYNNFITNHVPIYIDSKHAIAHNKIMIIDNKTVLTGSFNFTNAAQHSNAENSLHIIDHKLAKVYFDNWNHHKEHSHNE